MDPEPGRCRRTDGKKWRCQQAVVPNEKYCEKHMHRGSKRSRKLVEAPPKSRTDNFVNLIRNNNFIRDIRPEFQENLDQNAPTRVVLGAPGLTNATAKSKNTKQIEAKRDIVVNKRVAVINLASGMDFSPRSVLQNDRGMKCPRVESSKNNQHLPESRCKRTDGKRWQCKKEVVPDRKYCAQHINRGKMRSGKPCLGSSASGLEAQAAAYGSTSSATFSKTEQSKVDMSLDTNLKISLPTRQADLRNNIKGSMARDGSGTSSTEATESDESTDVSDIIVLSP